MATRRSLSLHSFIQLLLSFSLAECTVIPGKQWCAVSVPAIFQPYTGSGSGICPPAVDDQSADWSPWAHKPYCVTTAPRRAGDQAKKFCAYTNSRHGSRGLSLVTTPEAAADSTVILDEYMPPYDVGEEKPFKVVEVPNKGLGVVATRHISRYEEIMVDYASLAVEITFASLVPAKTGYRVLHLAVDQLADPESILGLGKSNDLAADEIENVLRTNAFHTILGGMPHMALYPVVSRINHACKPNAYTRFIPRTLSVSVGASRDIKPGEEITISYVTVGQTTAERHKALKHWGFECQCDLCTSSEQEIAASDARRREIDDLRGQAAAAYQEGKPYQALRLTRQVLGLIPSEELFPLYSEQYENIARIYWILGDWETGLKYARQSLDVLREQGYLEDVRPEHLEVMVTNFRQSVGTAGRSGKGKGKMAGGGGGGGSSSQKAV
ncbi:hypothetical protein B0H66DRAFT_638475 [Apodospora peruviana]|uniref:SET domain-containing protein n=1 Tax=Apodospora peruviana TaxID=516989 RepID=A0AAE0IBB4_9PEZI|nr:hypothetical protein B0H66DRAFT_638475 [Apodospora peruviana]